MGISNFAKKSVTSEDNRWLVHFKEEFHVARPEEVRVPEKRSAGKVRGVESVGRSKQMMTCMLECSSAKLQAKKRTTPTLLCRLTLLFMQMSMLMAYSRTVIVRKVTNTLPLFPWVKLSFKSGKSILLF